MTRAPIGKSRLTTKQEKLWAGKFGDNYIDRNKSEAIVSANIALFGKALRAAPNIKSIVELGCNIGLNLRALKKINNNFELSAYEINEKAIAIARKLKIATIVQDTALNALPSEKKYDLAFTKGLLIHVNPHQVEKVYKNLYNLSSRYILICEYFNPAPVTVTYRDNSEQLFKRDFAGELMDKYDLELVDYGFTYRRDNYAPQDDSTWFLLRKK